MGSRFFFIWLGVLVFLLCWMDNVCLLVVIVLDFGSGFLLFGMSYYYGLEVSLLLFSGL